MKDVKVYFEVTQMTDEGLVTYSEEYVVPLHLANEVQQRLEDYQ